MNDCLNNTNVFKNRFIPFDKVDVWVNDEKYANHPYVKELKGNIECNNYTNLNPAGSYEVFATTSEELNLFFRDHNNTEAGLKYSYPYILEIFGKSSMGKTQIMIQFLVSTLISSNLKAGESLYISTEDNIKIIYRRFKQMFDSHFGSLAEPIESQFLERIKFLYCRNFINFIEYQLEGILLSNKNIRYLFIDSISNDLRHVNDNILKYKIFSKISELSFKFKLLVFATNQVFTFIEEDVEEVGNKTDTNRITDLQQEQINPYMTYDYQLKHITNPLFFNRFSFGKNVSDYEKNDRFEVPTMGYLFNNFVNTRFVLFNMGAKGVRFLRVLYSDSWNNSDLMNEPEKAQLKYELLKNSMIEFKKEHH